MQVREVETWTCLMIQWKYGRLLSERYDFQMIFDSGNE